jgi:crotonobetainyl-CoA:carnitine CoA-transferase CaiB-like acyl-CoA transferase
MSARAGTGATARLDDPIGDLSGVTVTGPEHVLPSTFAVTPTAVRVIAAATAAVAEYGELRGDVVLDSRHAAVMVQSERHVRIEGSDPPALWERLAGDYRSSDGWIRLHTNYPHHRRAALAVLGTPADREAVAGAVASWSGQNLEDAIVAAGGCAAVMRSLDEWRQHPHGRHVTDRPVLAVEPAGGAPARVVPLGELRVLDLTRVIAGPVASRFLASWGADVLRVEAPGFNDGVLALDVGFGKRSCRLDLRDESDRGAFEHLVHDADVVIHGYRPGALAGLGYDTERFVALRPGLVVASLSAYGRSGPWRGRRGFDSLVQMSAGIAAEGGAIAGADAPVPLPCQLLDHATGYLLALGVLRARLRQQREGGSWTVEASLARTAAWLTAMDRVDALHVTAPTPAEADGWCDTRDTPWGRVRHVRPVGSIGPHRPAYPRPPSRPGRDAPAW